MHKECHVLFTFLGGSVSVPGMVREKGKFASILPIQHFLPLVISAAGTIWRNVIYRLAKLGLAITKRKILLCLLPSLSKMNKEKSYVKWIICILLRLSGDDGPGLFYMFTTQTSAVRAEGNFNLITPSQVCWNIIILNRLNSCWTML